MTDIDSLIQNAATIAAKAEAADAPLALGSQLEWESDGTFAFTPDAAGSYQIQYDFEAKRWLATRNWQPNAVHFVSRAEARVACEAHYATGTWE